MSYSDLYNPKLSKKAKLKIKKFQALKSENGFAIAYGMLLLAVSKKHVTFEELCLNYNNYVHKFANKYYIMPVLGDSLEYKLEIFSRYGYVSLKITKGIYKFRITSTGKSLIKSYIQDKEIFDLLKGMK